MNYSITKDKITIRDCQDFEPEHILECGQVFRYKKTDFGYLVFSQDKKAEIKKVGENSFEILSTDTLYFEHYFDLKTDYSVIKKQVLDSAKNSQFVKNALQFGNGIRILNQDYFEATISFIISQNNNIKRIQLIIDSLCKKYGKNMGDYYAFPTAKDLELVTENDYKILGAGYRASYLVCAVKFFANFDFDSFSVLPEEQMQKILLSVKGIGPKVADCIMLFAYHKKRVFPVDTWIEKVYRDNFATETEKQAKNLNRVTIRNNLVKMFDDNSGFAQQYLFYYGRSGSKI